MVPLVCTGGHKEPYAVLERRNGEVHLGTQVRFLGYVEDSQLAALYAHAVALVFPSRFEGWGLPAKLAFAHGLPVACSSATVLPEVAGGAALMFDPDDPAEIAAAINRLWIDEDLRADLIDRGHARAASLSWDRTARTFRALYRRVAGRMLSDEDRDLLAPPTLVP